MPLHLHLVRHGQTAASRENRFSGHIDPPLTDVGRAMADAIAAAYGGLSWAAVYTSPLLRCRQTAAPLCERARVEPIVEDGLKEIGYGEWEGLQQDEVRTRFPDAFAYWVHDVASRGTPGGETAFQVAARAMSAVERIRARHTDGNVLIVSHKATLRIVVCALLGMDVREFRQRIAQPVAAISTFEIGPKGTMLVRLGDVSHLSAELRAEPGT
jgi:broad specificity phosphatase PhoE